MSKKTFIKEFIEKIFKKPTIALSIVAIILTGFLSLYHLGVPNAKQKTYTIGLVMPMDHVALRDLVAGFKESLATNKAIEVEVQNAQGDLNIQRSIIQKFIHQKVDIIAPIGTTATQMTAALTQQIPIVSLAARYQAPKKSSANHDPTLTPKVTGVLDEIPVEKSLGLLNQVIPQLKKITLVHSSSEKIFPEIEEVTQYAAKKGFVVQKLMIQSLPDLYTAHHLIAKDTQAIFVLKDHLVVSGIQTLANQAKALKIPIMTSDEGSVKGNAAFALGVSEKSIGIEGAKLAIKVLSGESTSDLSIEIIKKLSVFYNADACLEQGLDIKNLQEKTRELGYHFVDVNQEGA